MSLASVVQVKDADSITGWVMELRAAYGQALPLTFSSISYAGNTPTAHTGITWKLLVKATKADTDADALINVTNADLTLTTDPLKVGYKIDFSAAGFERGQTYYGEFWADDTTYGKHPVFEFRIKLSESARATF